MASLKFNNTTLARFDVLENFILPLDSDPAHPVI